MSDISVSEEIALCMYSWTCTFEVRWESLDVWAWCAFNVSIADKEQWRKWVRSLQLGPRILPGMLERFSFIYKVKLTWSQSPTLFKLTRFYGTVLYKLYGKIEKYE